MMERPLPDVGQGKRVATLFLLPHCDMSCTFCASESGFSVMSFEEAAGLLRGLARGPVRSVVLGGGEPFLWPHGLVRLARLGRSLGLLVQVCTNGVHLPRGFERLEGIDRYILPLESMVPLQHDALRRHPRGHHAVVLQRIAELAGTGRQLTVSTVVTRANIGCLEAIADYLCGIRLRGVALHAWHLYRFLPVGRGGTVHATDLAVAEADYLRACETARSLARGFRVFRRPDMQRSSTVEYFWFERGRLRVGSEAITLSAAGAG